MNLHDLGWGPGTGPTDSIVVFPPPSPSDTNPPLGPALLAQAAAQRGIQVEILDLNMLHVNRYQDGSVRRPYTALGDHGKDRPLLKNAATALFDSFDLGNAKALFLPDTADPVAGMHFSFETLQDAMDRFVSGQSPLRQWIEHTVLECEGWPPAVFGVSIMGPSQVFLGLALLKLAKRHSPAVTTVIGGSHVTLLADHIRADARYRQDVDHVLPGHSEREFVDLVASRTGRVSSGRAASPSRGGPPFDYLPLFSPRQLSCYPAERLTLPMQFTRGCYYARCTYCTYPVVEPYVTKLHVPAARHAIEELVARYGVRRFSIKDSLFTPAMLERLSHALLEPPLGVEWSVTTKVDQRLVELAPLLAAAGLRTVELGVETIHPRGQRLFQKYASLDLVEDVVHSFIQHEVVVVVNLIFGLPGETLDEAERQLAWFHGLQSGDAGLIDGSLNMLEIVRGSPLAQGRTDSLTVRGVAPWAYCYEWNAPAWRPDFNARLSSAELSQVGEPAHEVLA